VILHRIGEIEWKNDSYHSSRYIFPVGFKSERTYPSTLDPSRRVPYTNEIRRGEKGPLFIVTASDRPGVEWTAMSTSGAWRKVVDELVGKTDGTRTHTSGPVMFGLADPSILDAVQSLPNARRCRRYTRQVWE
ncbi:MAG: F/Y-rich N-terminus-domain-containing protein, partial [Piptocephalis tieghemiana]